MVIPVSLLTIRSSPSISLSMARNTLYCLGSSSILARACVTSCSSVGLSVILSQPFSLNFCLKLFLADGLDWSAVMMLLRLVFILSYSRVFFPDQPLDSEVDEVPL